MPQTSETLRPRDARPPIAIPPRMKHDRAIRQLLAAWLHAHERYAVCRRRVGWSTPAARRVEKGRRREKWVCVARVLRIEAQLIRWLATATRHPDLWARASAARLPRRVELRRHYYRYRSAARHHAEPDRGDAKARLEAVVAEIRALDRAWIVALLAMAMPDAVPPAPLPLHPRELLPRKVGAASRALAREAA